MALVEAEALRTYLGQINAGAQALAVADVAAETASTYVAAYCTRLRVGDPVPGVVSTVALHLASRLAANPKALRGVTTEGQSVDFPPVGFTFLESVLLNPYRRRTA